MSTIDELKNDRLKKIQNIEAYPAESEYTKTIGEFLSDFNIEDKTVNTLVGRVMNMRSFGNLAFAKMSDQI